MEDFLKKAIENNKEEIRLGSWGICFFLLYLKVETEKQKEMKDIKENPKQNKQVSVPSRGCISMIRMCTKMYARKQNKNDQS